MQCKYAVHKMSTFKCKDKQNMKLIIFHTQNAEFLKYEVSTVFLSLQESFTASLEAVIK